MRKVATDSILYEQQIITNAPKFSCEHTVLSFAGGLTDNCCKNSKTFDYETPTIKTFRYSILLLTELFFWWRNALWCHLQTRWGMHSDVVFIPDRRTWVRSFCNWYASDWEKLSNWLLQQGLMRKTILFSKKKKFELVLVVSLTI